MENLVSKFGYFVLPLGIVLLASCVRSPVVIPEAGGQIGDGYGQMVVPEKRGQLMHASHSHQPTAGSSIEGQLQDGGWVMNIPGQPHTHRVVLSECPETPVVARHIHNHMQAEQLGKGPHKHRSCYICPPKNSLVKRIMSH